MTTTTNPLHTDFKEKHYTAYNEVLAGLPDFLEQVGLVAITHPTNTIQVCWAPQVEGDINLTAVATQPGQHTFGDVGGHLLVEFGDQAGKRATIQFWGVETDDLVTVAAQLAKLNQFRAQPKKEARGFGN